MNKPTTTHLPHPEDVDAWTPLLTDMVQKGLIKESGHREHGHLVYQLTKAGMEWYDETDQYMPDDIRAMIDARGPHRVTLNFDNLEPASMS
jgi:DNA-binding PadR family transcriptional regulator